MRKTTEDTMRISRFKIKMTFVEQLLASTPNNPEIFSGHILKKAEAAGKIMEDDAKEELSTLPQVEAEIDKMSTVFMCDDTGLFLYNYIIKGALKEWVSMGKDLGVKLGGTSAPFQHVRAIDRFARPLPRRIYLMDINGSHIKECNEYFERTLRGTTMRGERICLARSQVLPPGTNITFELHIIEPIQRTGLKYSLAFLNKEWIEWCFDMGAEHGFLQWRNGGFGRFGWEFVEEPSADVVQPIVPAQ